MKASEKIYIFENPASNECDDIWLSSRNFKKDIEYIRKDAFMKKAEKWLKTFLDNSVWIANDVGDREKEAVMEHFKSYMEGE